VTIGAKGAPTKKAAPKAPTTPKSAWRQFPLNPATTMFLDFTEANPDAVFSLFSRTAGITILKSPQFKSKITLASAKAVKLDEAFSLLNTVLGFQNYEMRKEGNHLLVAMKQPPPQPPQSAPPAPPQPVVKTYPLNVSRASDVAKIIIDIYGPAAAAGGGGQPQGGGEMAFVNGRMVPMGGGMPGGGGGGANPNFKVTSDDTSNAIVVKALPEEQTKIEALIKDLDKSTAPSLVTEIFALKYAPADQAVTAIEDILTANAPTGRSAARQTQQQPDYGYYGYYGGGRSTQRTAGGQSATAIKATNSVSVNATEGNMKLIRELLRSLDSPASFVDTTNVIKLQNAKATDVADLLNKAFTQQRSNNSDFGFFIYDSYGGGNQNNKQQTTDFDEEGRFVNVRDIQGKVTVQADAATNSLVVVTSPSNLRAIRKVVDQLDQVADQVVIETLIVEANLDRTTKLGIEYNFVNDLFNGQGNGVGSINFGIGSNTTTNSVQGATYTFTGDNYKIFLNAIQTDTRFKVLDTPRIFASNNAKAIINVSQRLPYITSTVASPLGGVTNAYQFTDVGVVLTVTPRITAGGTVTMDVEQSADDLQGFTTYNAPIINTRKATTTVSVEDSQTVVLGGIIRNTETRTDSKVPILGDLPLLGQLFRSTTRGTGQTELMVFLTPHIIHNGKDAQRLREQATKELTKPSQDSMRKAVPPVKEP